jgi:hypothetical protein
MVNPDCQQCMEWKGCELKNKALGTLLHQNKKTKNKTKQKTKHPSHNILYYAFLLGKVLSSKIQICQIDLSLFAHGLHCVMGKLGRLHMPVR